MDFTFDGISAKTFGLAVKSKNRTILPSIRQRYEQVIGRDGYYDFSDGTLDDRVIEIECCFYKNHVGDVRYNARRIAAWLFANGQKKRLVFSDEPDLYYFGRLANQIDFEQVATFGEFTLQFRCEPFAYGVELAADAYNSNSPTIMYRTIAPDDDYVYTESGGLDNYIDVNNYGTANAYPLIKVVANPLVSRPGPVQLFQAGVVGLPNYEAQFQIDTLEDNEVYIDMETFSAWTLFGLGGSRVNCLGSTSGKFWHLLPGINRIYIDNLLPGEQVEFSYRARFL